MTAVAGTAITTGPAVATAQAQTFELSMTSEGWVGRAPEAIAGTTNPTLEVEAGRQYVIRWTNETDEMHNLVIMDEDRSSVIRSDFRSESGQSQRVQFTASADLSSYFCEMDLEESGEFSVTGVETPTETEAEGNGETATPGDGGGETPTETTVSNGNGPGFGVLAAIAGTGAVALRAMRSDE